jgi:hypothetical protein
VVIKKKDGADTEKSKEEEENRVRKLGVEAIQFFKKNTGHIEVLRKDGSIEKTYFYLLPFTHALT